MIKNNCPPPALNKRPLGPVSGGLVLACLIFLGVPLTQLVSDGDTAPPGTRNGKPVKVKRIQPFSFNIADR